MRIHWILLAGLAALWSGCRSANPVRAANEAPPITVQVAEVCQRALPETYEAAGTVRARATVIVTSRVMAYVREAAVRAGDRVRQGQELVLLDSQDLDANVSRAEAAAAEAREAIPEADHSIAGAKANLDLAQATFHRMDELASKRSISNQEFDEASAHLKAAQSAYDVSRAKRVQLDARLAQAEQELRAAKVMFDYTRIVAPFAGVVTAKSVEPGSLAMPGAPLLTVERDGDYRLEASVDESKLPFVKTGKTVEVALAAPDRRFNARVSEIVPAVDSASRAYVVKIDLPSAPDVRSGMFGRAWFPMGERTALTVPSTAILERGQLQSVFVVENGVVRSRLVTLGARGPDWVEALSGLNEGEKVVSPAPPGLADGARVEVK